MHRKESSVTPRRTHAGRARGRLLALLALAALATVTQACAPAPDEAGAPAASTGTTQAAPRLYVFDGGILESDPTRYQMTREDVPETSLALAAYLIVHPNGTLMWDTGGVPDDEWTPTGSPVVQRLELADGQRRQVTIQRRLLPQLAEAGFSPDRITYLALSHYHWDHTANANAFAAATWLARREEHDAMFADTVPSARPSTYSALQNGRTQILPDGDYDVFGDGTVVLKPAPGHTPGHQMLYVKLASTGGVVLSGDLYHYPQERTLGRLPTFEWNQDQTRAARGALDAFLAESGAALWIQHDLVSHRQLRLAPAFYD